MEPKKVGSANLKAWFVVEGDDVAVTKWLSEAGQKDVSTIQTDHRINGRRTVSVLVPSNTPYRTMGGLIYSGQAAGLAITMKTNPPICENETK